MAQQDSSDRVQQGLKREYSEDKSKCLVTFWLAKQAAPEARCIALAGTLNNWDEKSHLLSKLESGDFALTVELEAGKEHEFRFLIDETRWENAWNADKYVWSPYGDCENSAVFT